MLAVLVPTRAYSRRMTWPRAVCVHTDGVNRIRKCGKLFIGDPSLRSCMEMVNKQLHCLQLARRGIKRCMNSGSTSHHVWKFSRSNNLVETTTRFNLTSYDDAYCLVRVLSPAWAGLKLLLTKCYIAASLTTAYAKACVHPSQWLVSYHCGYLC